VAYSNISSAGKVAVRNLNPLVQIHGTWCGHILIPVQQDTRQCEENTWNVYMVTHKFGKELKLNYAYNVLFLFHDDGLGPESVGGFPNTSV
jgi:hypothetical protein